MASMLRRMTALRREVGLIDGRWYVGGASWRPFRAAAGPSPRWTGGCGENLGRFL